MVAATSDIAKAADTLRDMIAATAGWQTWTGLSEAASKSKIDISEIPSASFGSARPRIRIGRGEGASHETASLATGQGGVASGTLRMTFVENHVEATAWEDAEMTFLNNAGLVVTDLVDAEDGLYNLRISQEGAVTRPDEVDDDDSQAIRATFIVRFGLEGVSA